MEANKPSRKILMFPWLAFGHISPFVELAKKLSQNNFQIFLCSSPVNLQSIKSKLPQNLNNPIQLIELNLPSLPGLPPHMHTTNGLPLHLNSTLHKAFDMAAPEFHSILQNLNPHLLITEFLQLWAIESASSLNIPVVPFFISSAGLYSHMFHSVLKSGVKFPFPELDPRHNLKTSENESMDPSLLNDLIRIIQTMVSREACSDVILINTFREFEDKCINYLSTLIKKKVVPVGPLVPEVDKNICDWTLEWLDKKEPKSTVYVSFGSETYLSKSDMEELAIGLEMSGANFIWAVRFPKGEEMKIEEALPEGFMERVGERGIVVDAWVPQLKILNHSSVGGFVSHGGWNSIVEAVVNGVPIIAIPLHLDHPCNSKVAEAAGVAIEAAKGGAIERQGVTNAIKQVLFEKIGKEFDKKGKEICESLKFDQGRNIEACVAELDRLCETKPVR